ncbi:acyl-CoA synthetase (AMP-forming)/AMP-acid ligase II [Actinomadura coerulea]|uniref:Acyl-CoA synthetase (AMP-forming)/AMP-acid ligase II n=1 Tax=Actinomadura coerulea TaxID=46159 RepID=A0A7X0KX73_9ACTN|nr:acyl-CoA synthetase [Actinomadura coerulea]MBB6394036.1 acyl-CoA synthetase (AMP-forming)/AMP-acid ligase II [Actinomadura coerulea]GGQ19848.1 acyl-CoA synthetase [Actinomadura coerulea]
MHLGQIAARTPDKPAVVMAGSGRVVTFRELNEESNRLAQLLRSEGLRPGDHIAFMLENHPFYLAIAWAAQRSGLYYTAIGSRLQADELAYIAGNCEAKVFITSASMETAAQSPPDVPLRLMLGGTAPGYASYEERVAQHPPTPIEDECEGADMLYSSGTTGRPKGVKPALSKAPMGEGGTLYQLLAFLFQPDADSVYLSPAPLYHAAPLRYSLNFHRFGATVVVMEKFDPEQALAAVEKYRVTHSQWVPTMFIRMLKLPEETRARYDVSSLRCAVHAAAPCPVPVKEQMIAWWGPILHEYYAGTEGNCFVYTNSEDWLAHKGTVGRPILGEVHVCDEDGRELPPGESGTLYFGGGPEFEYHADEAKTAASRDPRGHGWTTLGDVGHVDDDGFLYLTDRRAYLIISGGVNIYPQEAENVLAVHPKVADVAVFGVPDAEMGEAVKAVVQPLSMDDAGPGLEAELIAYCRDRLAHYKCPRSVDFRGELPRHPTGKLYKRLLKDEYWADKRSATA